MNDIDIVYTMWANLKKTAGMEVILQYFLFNTLIPLGGDKACTEVPLGVNCTFSPAKHTNQQEQQGPGLLSQQFHLL